MTQFDVYENANENRRGSYPLLLDIQADILSDLNTRIIVPLIPLRSGSKPLIFTPVIDVEEQRYIALFNLMASYPVGELGACVTNLSDLRSILIAAYDFVIQGY